jgi:streptogramin lyase
MVEHDERAKDRESQRRGCKTRAGVYAASTDHFDRCVTLRRMNTIRNITRGVPIAALAAAILALSALAASPGVKVIRLKGLPDSVTSAYGSVWVSSHVGKYLYRINPGTNRVVKSIWVGENQCLPLASGAGAIWVPNCAGETGHAYVYEISAKHNKVIHRINAQGVVFGDNSVWTMAGDQTTLLRIDPRSRLTLARITIPTGPVGDYGPFVAADCDGSLWLNADTAEVRIDTATNKVTAVIQLPGSASDSTATDGYFSSVDAACAGGKLWVPNLAGLFSIDEHTNTATRLPIAIRPNHGMGDPGITASGNNVFVRTSDTTVTQVDASNGNAVHTYPAAGAGGGQLTVANASVWIPAFNTAGVWRDLIQAQ